MGKKEKVCRGASPKKTVIRVGRFQEENSSNPMQKNRKGRRTACTTWLRGTLKKEKARRFYCPVRG